MKRILFLLIPLCLGLSLAVLWGGATRAADTQGDPVVAQPHLILSDQRVRQAIAHCTDKDGLVAAAYPDLTPPERQALIIDSFISPTSWAYSPPTTTYEYSPTLGGDLLDDAGWLWPVGENYRMKDGRELAISLKTTDTQLRIDLVNAYTAQLAACGIRLIGFNLPASYLFNDKTGLGIRDFSIAEFAWIWGVDEVSFYELYGCDAIPSPSAGWDIGLNRMGWCNPDAEAALINADDTSLPQDERKAYYAQVTEYFAQDVPSIPLFLRDGTLDTWEHFDFNLETFSSWTEIISDSSNVLSYRDFYGNSGWIEVPPGALITPTQVNDLVYSPLAVTFSIPDGWRELAPFRLTMFTRGVPQETYSFSQPITLTVPYSMSYQLGVIEETISLYIWNNDTWQYAVDTCPVDDRYSLHDTQNDLYIVRVCHLSEFTLSGELNNLTFLPMATK
jgi:hypothetical protein